MPTQVSLLEELCKFHHRRIKTLDNLARVIRGFFQPYTYRPTREKGSHRHSDLFGLSVEEIVTLLDELIRYGRPEPRIIRAHVELRDLVAELISYLSLNGAPIRNHTILEFSRRVLDTDCVITFNWDTLLDRRFATRANWDPSFGYGRVAREYFNSAGHPASIPKKYAKLIKLHGSVNWLASSAVARHDLKISKTWGPEHRIQDVVMIPPKMIKAEIWGRASADSALPEYHGIDAVPAGFFPKLWREAEEQLEVARRVVFIGYSFPPADFTFKNLFRRANFYKDRRPVPAIDIVDPNAADLARRFQASFRIPVPLENQYLSLKSYLTSPRPPA